MIRRLLRPWWVRWVVLPLLALVASHAGWTFVLKWRFERRIEELRTSGAPVELRDLARPRIPEQDNAAALWEEAHRWHETHLKPAPAGASWGENLWTDEDRAEIAAWLAKGDLYADLLARAAAKPGMWQDLDWEAGPAMELSALPELWEAVAFLGCRIRLAERADSEAVRDLTVVLDLATKLERPLLTLMLTRWAIEGSSAAVWLRALAAKPGFAPREARALLDPRFAATDDPGHLRDALRGERVVGLSFSRRWIGGESPGAMMRDAQVLLGDRMDAGETSFMDRIYGSWVARPLAYRDALRLLDLMEAELRLVDIPPREAFSRAEALRAEYQRGLPNVASHLFAMLPAGAFRVRLRHLAEVRVARVGLAVLELRQQTGAWPETLDAIVPLVGEEWVEDPFTGDRLQYEPGVRVEAAVPIANEDLREDDEIVWRLPPFPAPHPLPR